MFIYIVFPIGNFAAEIPQDFESYDDALSYGVEHFGIRGKDFIIEEVI